MEKKSKFRALSSHVEAIVTDLGSDASINQDLSKQIQRAPDPVRDELPAQSVEPFRFTDTITARLEARYGVPKWYPRLDPADELVACILSQNTSDTNSVRAFEQLKSRFPTWEQILTATVLEIADTIRNGGLADSKAPRIQNVLRAIHERHGSFTLDFLNNMTDGEARSYLMDLPGVGPKTAAIVLCFALGRPVLPVDTHVFRVAWRLGLIEKRIGENRAHDALQQIIRPDNTYRFHVALITHGRQICKAIAPRCAMCPLSDLCRFYGDNRTLSSS